MSLIEFYEMAPLLYAKLEDQGELVITVNGKRFAVMIDLADGENMECLWCGKVLTCM